MAKNSNTQKGRFRSMPLLRKLGVVAMAFTLVVSTIGVILTPNNHGNTRKSSKVSVQQTSGKTSRNSSSSRSSPEPSATPDTTVINPNGPVAAAKAAMESLEAAQFLPRRRAASIVRSVMEPSKTGDQKRALRFRAPAFAQSTLGYTEKKGGLSAAQELSNYSYVATKGHLDLLVGDTAIVSLFGQMSWLGPPNTQDRQKPGAAYDLRTLYLARVKPSPSGKNTSRWMLTEWLESPNQPTAPNGKTLSQAKAKNLYAPLLKDFQKL
jgi:hypothetical protein